jgi:hypothetical protein
MSATGQRRALSSMIRKKPVPAKAGMETGFPNKIMLK